MNLYITDDHTAEVLHAAPYPDDLPMDEAQALTDYLDREGCGRTISTTDGYVPLGCGDVTVTFSENPIDHPVVWSSTSFFLDLEAY